MRETTLKLLFCAALIMLAVVIGYGLVNSTVLAGLPAWPPPPIIKTVVTPVIAGLPAWPPPPIIKNGTPLMAGLPAWPPPPIIKTVVKPVMAGLPAWPPPPVA